MEKKKMKLWKKIVIGVLTILIVILSIILYRYSILSTIKQRNEISNEKSNLYYYSQTDNTITEYWRKDGIMKANIRLINGTGDIIFWQDTNTEEEQLIFWNIPEKIYSKNQSEMLKTLAVPMVSNEEHIMFLTAFNPKLHMKTMKYNNRKCYYIKINNQEEIIEKDTGLILYNSNNGNEIKVNYSFGNVTDKDVEKPDITQYKFRENN